MPAWGGRLDDADHQGAGRLRPHARRRREVTHVPGCSIAVDRTRSRRCSSSSRTAESRRRAQRCRPATCPSPTTTARSTRRAARSIRSASRGTFRTHQMGRALRHARHLLPAAVRALGSRAERARPGGADRFSQPALLLLLHRDLAAGGLLPHRPADPRGDGAVPDERGRRPRLVRLSLPADGVDRPVPRHRALGRRRPPRAHAARRGAVDRRPARGARPGSSISSG